MNIAEALREASHLLQGAGVPEARREAGSLLSFVIAKDRTFLISHADEQLDEHSLDQFREAVERRKDLRRDRRSCASFDLAGGA